MKSFIIALSLLFTALLGSADASAWTPILGIPDPPFGIKTTHTMYAGAGFTYDYSDDRTGPVPYRIGACGPYTHYVDPSHPNADDTNNPHGTEAKPRVTRPNPPFAAGTVLYIHSGTHGAFGPLAGSGTPAKPIFIRGNPNTPPVWTGVFDLNLDYVVMENFRFDLETYARKTIRIGPAYKGARTHIAIRNCKFYNGMYDPTSSYQVIRIIHPWNTKEVVQNIVIYNNYFHNIGDGRSTPTKRDVVGVSVDVNAKNIWIIDNTFYKLGGDAVQVASDGASYSDPYLLPNHIYIGRNAASDMYENFVDLKTCQDVIISQNVAYNFGEGYGTLGDGGAAFRYGSQDINKGDQRKNIWTMYNKAYNMASSDGAFLNYNKETENFADETYFIGNIVYNCHNTAGNATAFSSWNTRRIYWAHNLAYNCDRGGVFFGDRTELTRDEKLTVVNNIFGDLHANTANSVWLSFGGVQASLDRAVISNNIYYGSDATGRIKWGIYSGSGQSWNDYTYSQFADYAPSKVVGSMNTDPKHVDPPGANFQLLSGSPAINAGYSHAFWERFYQLYGIDVRENFTRNKPPLVAFDIGPQEYQSATLSPPINVRIVR